MGDPGLLLGGGGLPRLKGEFARRRTGESTRRRTGESGSRLGDPLRPIGDLRGGEAGFRRGDTDYIKVQQIKQCIIVSYCQ